MSSLLITQSIIATITDVATYNDASCLIYGIGNVGRQDDGLGWAFIDWLDAEGLCPKADLMRHYQLQLEDADLISYKKRVLFIDATKVPGVESFHFEKVESKMDYSFSSHAISIPSIMATCQTCFDYTPDVHLLTIKGYEWELQEGLSSMAKHNLDVSTEFFRQHILLNKSKVSDEKT